MKQSQPTPIKADAAGTVELFKTGEIHLSTNYNQLFTVEEAFVRLGQSCQTGELLVLNKDESIHVFVENGFVVHAHGESESGEAALIHALNLENSNFVWVAEARPLDKDLQIDIRQYVLRHSLSRDLKNAQSVVSAQKHETLLLPRTDGIRRPLEKAEEDTDFYFVTAVDPMGRIPLKKTVVLVGREIYCDWVLDDFRISRKHCVLQLATRGVLVRDLEATNGTFINGRIVTDGYMKPGDKLSLGGYILILRKENPVPVPHLSKFAPKTAQLLA